MTIANRVIPRTVPVRRGPWVTAAAAILIIEGVVAIAYLPMMGDGRLFAYAAGIAIANIATGIGLLRLSGWARLVAAVLAAIWTFVDVTSLLGTILAAPASGVTLNPFAPVELILSLVVLFAVMRRWPARTRQPSRSHPV